MHRGDAGHLRTSPQAEVDFDEVDRILADLSKTDWTTEGGASDAGSRREDLLSNSGLPVPRSGQRASFYHLSFQEFLAAVRLRWVGEKPRDVLAQHSNTKTWHRTLKFLFCAVADKDSPEETIRGYESLLSHLEPGRLEAEPVPALLPADCLEAAHARGWNLERFATALRAACQHALEHLARPSALIYGSRSASSHWTTGPVSA